MTGDWLTFVLVIAAGLLAYVNGYYDGQKSAFRKVRRAADELSRKLEQSFLEEEQELIAVLAHLEGPPS